MQFGGGLNLPFTRHISIRFIDADYVRSTLPNSAGNVSERSETSRRDLLPFPFKERRHALACACYEATRGMLVKLYGLASAANKCKKTGPEF